MINTRKVVKFLEITFLAVGLASIIAAFDSYIRFRFHDGKTAIDAYFALLQLGLYKINTLMALVALGFSAVLHLLRINREEQINKPQ